MTAPKRITVGILGVGRLAEFLVAGLRAADGGPRILLSPRNTARAAHLADRYGLTIAGDNAELVAVSDLVLLATRSDQAAAAVIGLPWREDQVLVSLCAGVPLAGLAAHCGGARLARAMPISASMIGESPTCLHPDLDMARSVLSHLGPVIAVAGEAAFEAASVLGAYYGWVHALIGAVSERTVAAGVDAEIAREVTARMTRAAAGMVLAQKDLSFEEIMAELATPGGVTALGLSVLEDRAALEAWQAAFDAVLARFKAGEDFGAGPEAGSN